MKMKIIKKILSLGLAIALIPGMITGCRSGQSPETTEQSDTQPTVQDTRPALVVERTRAKAGDKDVEVVIEVKNNPGILGIDFDLYYDETALCLADAKSVLDLDGCVYTEPAYYRNPTTFLWDFQDANWTGDGVFIKLYFDILDTASPGEHEIKIMYSYGSIFDANLEPIDVGVRNGCISVFE